MKVIRILPWIALVAATLLTACESTPQPVLPTPQLVLHLAADFECSELCWDNFDEHEMWLDGNCMPHDVLLAGRVEAISGSIPESVSADITAYDNRRRLLRHEKIPIQLRAEQASTFRMRIDNGKIDLNSPGCDFYYYEVTFYSLEGEVISYTGD